MNDYKELEARLRDFAHEANTDAGANVQEGGSWEAPDPVYDACVQAADAIAALRAEVTILKNQIKCCADCMEPTYAELRERAEKAEAEVEALKAENGSLAAGQCCRPKDGLTADDHGNAYCNWFRKCIELEKWNDEQAALMHDMGLRLIVAEGFKDRFVEINKVDIHGISKAIDALEIAIKGHSHD